MTSFQFDVGGRRRKASRFIARVRRELLAALAERRAKDNLTQQAIAHKLNVHRSVINRQFNDDSNLTLRSISDLAWALDKDIEFKLVDAHQGDGRNVFTVTRTERDTQSAKKGATSIVASSGKSDKLSPRIISSNGTTQVKVLAEVR